MQEALRKSNSRFIVVEKPPCSKCGAENHVARTVHYGDEPYTLRETICTNPDCLHEQDWIYHDKDIIRPEPLKPASIPDGKSAEPR